MGKIHLRGWPCILVLAALVRCGGGQDAPGGQQPPPPPAIGLDVYVYTDLATDRAARATFFDFAQAKRVRRVYLQSGGLLGASRAALGDFVADAKGRGLSVTLLFGRAEWALRANHAAALQCITQSLAFLAELKAAGKPAPDAVQFDIEPYLLPEWDADLMGTANQYLDLLAALRARLNGQLPLTVAVPFWLDTHPVTRAGQTRPLSEWTLDAVDGIVMMAYRDRAKDILKEASTEMAYASLHGQSVVLALDVECGSPTPYITFCEEGEAFMLQEMATVDSTLRAQAAYRGMGIFHYEDWRQLRP